MSKPIDTKTGQYIKTSIPWYFNNELVSSEEDMPKGVYGFIYKITFVDGTCYYGKKNVYTEVISVVNRNTPMDVETTKKRIGGKLVDTYVKLKSTNWRTYNGSSEYIVGRIPKKKEILKYCFSSKELTYEEDKLLFKEDVLLREDTLNMNIGGKFYRKEIREWEEHQKSLV